MSESFAEEILRTLQQNFVTPKWAIPNEDSFETLIATIISQNTTGRNAERALERLSKHFEMTPEALAKAETSQIEECLKVSGFYRNKAKVIKQTSQIILDKFHGTLNKILAMPLDEARNTLLQLPGVGPKTADVVLLFCSGKPTIPVDTHVNRVSKRLGFAPERGDYETVRESLQSLFKPRDYLEAHALLIVLGRKYCKARNPQCKQCPVNTLCSSKQL